MRTNYFAIGVFLIILGMVFIISTIREAYQVQTVIDWKGVDVNSDGKPDYKMPVYGWKTEYRTVFPLRGIGIVVMLIGAGILAIEIITFRKTQKIDIP